MPRGSYRFINLNIRRVRKAAFILPVLLCGALLCGTLLSALTANPEMTACAAFYSGGGMLKSLNRSVMSPDLLLVASLPVLSSTVYSPRAGYRQSYMESFFGGYSGGSLDIEKGEDGAGKPKNAKPVVAISLSPVITKNHLVFGHVVAKNEGAKSISLDSVMATALSLKLSDVSAGPQVLIVHTHATEAYSTTGDYYVSSESPRSTDNTRNVVRVGEEFAKTLEKNGIRTLHDKTHHDYPAYSGSYTRSAATIERYLKKYPTIRVVLDVHRDSIVRSDGTKIRAVANIGESRVAQVMVLVGAGNATLPNNHWKDNLRFGVTFNNQLEKDNPGLSRAMLIRDSNYNMSLCKGGLLLEMGTCGNTLDEALLAAELTGRSLAAVLKTLKAK